MIWESGPWRQELASFGARLVEWSNGIYLDSEEFDFELEKGLLVSAFAIRKLLDARKFPDSVRDRSIDVRLFPSFDESADLHNWHHLERYFDFNNPVRSRIGLRKMVDQFIHSVVLCGEFGNDDLGRTRLASILVASDHQLSKGALSIDARCLGEEYEILASREVRCIMQTRNERGKTIDFRATD